MRVSLSYVELKESLFKNLELLRTRLRIGHGEWARALGLSSTEYRQFYLTEKDLPIDSFSQLTEYLELSFDSILKGNFNFDRLAKRVGSIKELPEKYLVSPFGRKKTISNVVDYVGSTLSYDMTKKISETLGFSLYSLHSKDEPVNLLLGTDVFRELTAFGASTDYFMMIGRNSIATSKEAPFARRLRKERTTPDLLKRYLEVEVKEIDQNYGYRIVKNRGRSITMEAHEVNNLRDAFRQKHYGSQEICAYKTGALEVVPSYAGLPGLRVRKTACIHQGDAACRWELEH